MITLLLQKVINKEVNTQKIKDLPVVCYGLITCILLLQKFPLMLLFPI